MPIEHADVSKKNRLQQQLLVLSVVNLLIVALLGVLLRAYPFTDAIPFAYKNLLHGHSHFAFTGWLTPVLIHLVMKYFPQLKKGIPFRHWRNISVLFLLSAYGMLVFFPFQGYKAASISFSTLAIVATFYLALQCRRASRRQEKTVSLRFLNWGLFYGCLSAIGPFAVGPLMALGKSGSPLYFDAVYFYLHFQYNGLFTFVVLALLYQLPERRLQKPKTKLVFHLFNCPVIPAYALSVLWHQPPVFLNWIGGAAGLIQIVAVFLFLHEMGIGGLLKSGVLLRLSLAAFVTKAALQAISAFPSVALLAYQQRSFVIAYLHLVLLGFVTLAIFALTLKQNRWTLIGIVFFLFSFLTTESLLLLHALSGMIPFVLPPYLPWLLLCSVFFPVGVVFFLVGLFSQSRNTTVPCVQQAGSPQFVT